MMDTRNFEKRFDLTFAVAADDHAGVYVGYCYEIGAISQGTTPDEAMIATVDAAQLLIVWDLVNSLDPLEVHNPLPDTDKPESATVEKMTLVFRKQRNEWVAL